jgi:cob(I)alamin adenosyltransferase
MNGLGNPGPFTLSGVEGPMGENFMGIVTKKGDTGTSKMLSGKTVSKSDVRLCALGTLDELTSVLGLARSFCKDKILCSQIRSLQINLIRLAAELSSCGRMPSNIEPTGEKHIKDLEREISTLEDKIKLPPSLILPGGSSVSSALDMARSISRRMEREIVMAKEEKDCYSGSMLIYINRLSDYLFLLARHAEITEGKEFDTAVKEQ